MEGYLVIVLNNGLVYVGKSVIGAQWITVRDALVVSDWETGRDITWLVKTHGEYARITHTGTTVRMPFASVNHMLAIDPDNWARWEK